MNYEELQSIKNEQRFLMTCKFIYINKIFFRYNKYKNDAILKDWNNTDINFVSDVSKQNICIVSMHNL